MQNNKRYVRSIFGGRVYQIYRECVLNGEKRVFTRDLQNGGIDEVSEANLNAFEEPINLTGRWKHNRSGATYEVLLLTNMESDRVLDYPPSVVYKNVETGVVWSRPISAWFGNFTKV